MLTSKKASRSLQRLRALKGEQAHLEVGSNTNAKERVSNDQGFPDVRTLQEKQRLLLWVIILLLPANCLFRPILIVRIIRNPSVIGLKKMNLLLLLLLHQLTRPLTISAVQRLLQNWKSPIPIIISLPFPLLKPLTMTWHQRFKALPMQSSPMSQANLSLLPMLFLTIMNQFQQIHNFNNTAHGAYDDQRSARHMEL